MIRIFKTASPVSGCFYIPVHQHDITARPALSNTGYALKQAVENTSARVHVFTGEKENREILRSAEAIRKAIPESRLRILPGFRHGEFSLNHAEAYIGAVLREILAQPIREEGNPPGP